MAAKEDAKGYFTGSLSQEGLKKRETAAEEDVSRDEMKIVNWGPRMRHQQKKKPRKNLPKNGPKLSR